MDGRKRCHDNIFIERLWRSLKYELIYLWKFKDGKHLKEEVKIRDLENSREFWKQTVDLIKEALETITSTDVKHWEEQVFDPSTLSKRKRVFSSPERVHRKSA